MGGGGEEGVNRTAPTTLDTIHPIDLKSGTYNNLHLYFQLRGTTWYLIGFHGNNRKKMTSQAAAILDFQIFRFFSKFYFSTSDWAWKFNLTQSSPLSPVYRHNLTPVRPGLKLTLVSFCRIKTANSGSIRLKFTTSRGRVSLEKCRRCGRVSWVEPGLVEPGLVLILHMRTRAFTHQTLRRVWHERQRGCFKTLDYRIQ